LRRSAKSQRDFRQKKFGENSKRDRDLDDLTARDIPRTAGIAATGAIARRLKEGPAGYAGADLDADW
jgi:hypothetical protein